MTLQTGFPREIDSSSSSGLTPGGIVDNYAALQALLTAGGVVTIPPGGYLISSGDPVVGDGTWLVCEPGAYFIMSGHSIQIGSKTAQFWKIGAQLNVQGTAAANHALVEAYNLLGDHELGARQIVVTLSASSAAELYHAHSTNQCGGYADVKHVISTADYTCTYGLYLFCGDHATIPSYANDFINGNTFEGTLAATSVPIRFRGLGPVGGSVLAYQARNYFDRIDTNSYSVTGVQAVTDGPTRNVFNVCTFEGQAGAPTDIDMTGAANGQYWHHPICRTKATQILSARDVWVEDEFDIGNDYGVYRGMFFDGTVAAPGLGFNQDKDNGLVREASDDWSLVAKAKKVLRILGIASAVNNFLMKHSATGVALSLEAEGTDADISINLLPKGAGVIKANSVPVLKQSGSGTRSGGDITLGFGGALTDATDVTTTLTLLTGTSGKVMVTCTGSWNGTVGGGAEFALFADGVKVASVLDTLASSGGNQPFTLTWLATGLAAGARIFKLQWRTVTSNGNLNGGTTATRVTSIQAVEV